MKYKFFKVVDKETGVFYHLDLGVISDEEYDFLKPIIEHLGGHWREKFKCFVFGEDVSSQLDEYMKKGVSVTEQYKFQEETQFYPTPMKVAQRVYELAEIKENQSVLEPSAGTGNLLDCIPFHCDIIAVEPLMSNFIVLEHKGYNAVNNTFEGSYSSLPKVDRIIMNPPFSGQRDIKHVMMAYHLLKKGGVLVAIMSENALYYNTETTKKFKAFLKRHNGYVETVPPRSFKESGTTIETVIVKIRKG